MKIRAKKLLKEGRRSENDSEIASVRERVACPIEHT
jgi:hypothetical protein